ncbi:MAG TPA: hypothetical protein VG253_14650 [Streptosporangiaceae bacterium]|nr:hypothetical protein [Streptosporangiaceae bacterium]
MPSDDEFLSRFGDVIDDRIAEILDDLIAERDARRARRRLPDAFGTLALAVALAASVPLRHSALAVCMIWASAATVCLAVAWIQQAATRRPDRRPGE